MRLENNLLYGDPTRIIAIGTNKNLVQGAQPPNDKRNERRDPVRDLEAILEATYGKERLKKESAEKQRKRLSEGSIPKHSHNNICEKKLSVLRKILEFTGVI